jgi:oligopeptide transport system substrate-binding protein
VKASVRLLFIIAATVLVLGSQQGCGRRAGESGASGDGPATPATLNRALGGEPDTLDPQLAEDNAALALLQELYEGLSSEAADGRIGPGAAEAWTVAPGGLSWTFRLREGLRWSNGDPLTARDFVAGLEAVRSPGTQAPYAALLENLTTIHAPDPRTVVIELSRPLPQLPALLAMPFAAPRRSVPVAGAALVSNGPYRLLSRSPGQQLVLERNPYYREAKSVAIGRVTYLTLEDLNTELNLYRADELDISSEVPNAQIGWLRQNLPGELRVAPYLSTYAYVVNLARVSDRDARTALAMAIDRRQITELVTGAGELPAFSWVPPGIPGYAGARFGWADASPDARTASARAHWAAARERGAAPGHLNLCTDASANHRRTAVALADQWRSTLGLEVTITEMEWKAYLARREQPGDCDLLRFGWSADYVDAEAFLALFATGHAQNLAGYANPAYDRLLDTAELAPDSAQRAAALAQAEQILLDDAVVIPVFHRVSKRLVKPYVDGVVANPLGHLPSQRLRLRETRKK